MKRKVLKKLLPFLMALTLAGTTVFAEGEGPAPPLSVEETAAIGSEESGGEVSEEGNAEGEESPEGAEADGTEESTDESEIDSSEECPDDGIDGDGTESPDDNVDEDGTEGPDDNVDGDETENPDGNVDEDGTEGSDDNVDEDGTENPDVNVDGDETENPDGNVDGDGTESPDNNVDGDGTENPDDNVDEDETGSPDGAETDDSDESAGENGNDASEEDSDEESDTEDDADFDEEGDISFDEGGEEVNAGGAEGPEPSFEDELVQANETYTSTEGFQFYITWSGSAVISGYSKSVSSLVIPAKVTYRNTTYNVEGIGDSAFKNNTTITAVQIAEGPTYIGQSAFEGCRNLQSVSFPRTLKQINDMAFNCYPDKIVQAYNSGYMLYRGSGSLKKLVFAEGLERIGNWAFSGQPLKEGIIFPSTLKQIGGSAFWNSQCPTLSFPSGLESIGSSAFEENQELRTLMIPGNVKQIGSYAFAACSNLNNVSLGNGIQEIGYKAFAGTGSLKTIYIPKSVVTIGASPFASNYYVSYNSYTSSSSNYGQSKYQYFYSALTTVYCEAGSAADNAGNYGSNVEIVHGNLKVAAPTFNEVAYIGGKDISFTSATKDAVIYYSTTNSNITTKDKWVANGGRASLGGFNGTVYARAYYGGQWSSVASYVVKTAKVATPTITVSGSKVTIKASTSGSTLYYTTDGSTPTVEKGIKANGTSVSLDSFAGLVKAIAVKSGCSNSAMAKKSLVNSAKNRNVSFAVKGVFGGRKVTFNSSVKGAKVYYSSTTSKLTTKDKCVNAGSTVLFENFYGTIYARTYYNGEWGNVCRLVLKIPKVNAPSVEKLYTQRRVRKYNSYTGKYYYTTETVASGYAILSTSTPSSIIYYTLDGTTPSPTNGRKLNASRGKVYVGTGHTIKAIAVRNCFTNSGVTTYR